MLKDKSSDSESKNLEMAVTKAELKVNQKALERMETEKKAKKIKKKKEKLQSIRAELEEEL